MGTFALEDTFIKAASRRMPIGQVLMLFGLGGAIVFAVVAVRKRNPFLGPAVRSNSMRLRMVFEISGRLFYSMAVALTPLSATTVILQATPLVVVAGAAILFRERVGFRRWAAVLVGLAGVIVVVGPGRESFSLLSLLAVLGMLGFAGRDLASRAAPPSIGTAILGFYGFVSVFIAGGMIGIWQGRSFVWPSAMTAGLIVAAIGVGVGAYACLMKAMRTGQVSAVTPFRYSRLLFGIGLGIVYFQESFTLPMVVGSVLIVASGLMIMAQSRRRLLCP
ncbi:EamA-like transporter family protein [Crateriforma conspicua]|uniref:EamA-like transporter family protein n=2 Tax=Crateriforma conspicua TaxID=2527996 RepID=A0A5C5Y0N3_9PLAN|nr:EamA-like transporter family protein [Crateriforma conspicua]TWT68163.1 EamA-like transporter family protein [Crateriforma conspicua]